MASAPFQRDSIVDLLRTSALLYIVGFWHLFEYSDALSFHKTPLFVSPTAEGARYIFDINLLVAIPVYGLLGLLAGRLIRVLVGDTSRR